jgi:hypothetical protein
MHVGTAIFAIGVLYFLVVSPGFRRVALLGVAAVVGLFVLTASYQYVKNMPKPLTVEEQRFECTLGPGARSPYALAPTDEEKAEVERDYGPEKCSRYLNEQELNDRREALKYWGSPIPRPSR